VAAVFWNPSRRHHEFSKPRISDIIDMFQMEVPMFSQILMTIGQILENGSRFFEIKDNGSRHLEKYPSGWTTITNNEFMFVIFNQKCNFYWGILTFKGCLLSVVLVFKRYFAWNPHFYGSKFGGFLYLRPPHSEFEGTKPPKGTHINRNTSIELLSV